jgi:hypothetical protein
MTVVLVLPFIVSADGVTKIQFEVFVYCNGEGVLPQLVTVKI